MSSNDNDDNSEEDLVVSAALAATKGAKSCTYDYETVGCIWSSRIAACIDQTHDSDTAVANLTKLIQDYVGGSTEFIDYCVNSGLVQPTVHWNMEGFKGSHSFWEACCRLVHLSPSASYGLVFHGTAENNVPAILKDGLDPKKRTGQAYGVGEYFSKDPSVSTSYCKMGKKMLIFLVVLPRDADAQSNSQDPHPSRFSPIAPRPADYVVVSETTHQFPLGYVQFDRVEHAVLSRSHRMRMALQQLNREAHEKQRKADDASVKAGIIQLLLLKEIDTASHRYQKHRASLSHDAKREISSYANVHLDPEFVAFYFPELPIPMDADEHRKRPTETVEQQQADADRAWKKLDDRRLEISSGKSSSGEALWAFRRKEADQAREKARKLYTDEQNLKSEIIQLLIDGEIETASHKFTKHRAILSEATQSEIGQFARVHLSDPSFVDVYFPNLPGPVDPLIWQD